MDLPAVGGGAVSPGLFAALCGGLGLSIGAVVGFWVRGRFGGRGWRRSPRIDISEALAPGKLRDGADSGWITYAGYPHGDRRRLRFVTEREWRRHRG